MRIELNLETGEQTEHEDAPVTWVEPEPVVIVPPTVEELMAKLNAIQEQIKALGVIEIVAETTPVIIESNTLIDVTAKVDTLTSLEELKGLSCQ